MSEGSEGPLGSKNRKPLFFIQTDFKEITNGPQATIAVLRPNQMASQIGGHNFNHTIELEECQANAKVMTAASELLELGNLTRDLIYDNFKHLPEEIRPLLNKWRKAIQKATS